MFKFNPSHVFTKANSMSHKQAYTWGAVVVVLVVAFFMLASLMGNAEDQSFSGLDSRGYDLAQMPFVNDEAEQYLLASKYPDMQGNNSTLLYSSQQKEERQAKDAEEESTRTAETVTTYKGKTSSAPTSRPYRGRNYGGGSAAAKPTQVGKLSSGNIGRASGSGISSSYGAPRGDFSPYRSQDKGQERPVQFKNQDARKALYQFARGSQAAAGLKEGKSGNAKRALMGGDIAGGEAFDDGGIDLSKATGLAIDTEAPAIPDLSNLEQDLKDATERAQKEDEEKDNNDEKTWAEKMKEELLLAAIDVGKTILTNAANKAIDKAFGDTSSSSSSSSSSGGDKPSGGNNSSTPSHNSSPTPSHTTPSSDPVPDDPNPGGGRDEDDGIIPTDLFGNDGINLA